MGTNGHELPRDLDDKAYWFVAGIVAGAPFGAVESMAYWQQMFRLWMSFLSTDILHRPLGAVEVERGSRAFSAALHRHRGEAQENAVRHFGGWA